MFWENVPDMWSKMYLIIIIILARKGPNSNFAGTTESRRETSELTSMVYNANADTNAYDDKL